MLLTFVTCFLATSCAAERVFRVQDQMLVDYNGRPFFARGINLQYGDNPKEAIAAIEPISQTKSNMIRLELRMFTTSQELLTALEQIAQKNMAVMLMMWDEFTTCTNNRTAFDAAVNYWLQPDVRKVIQEYSWMTLLNIVNEYSHGYSSDTGPIMKPSEFRDLYKDAIRKLREGGYKIPIVIDAYHCGQQADVFLRQVEDQGPKLGQELVDSDPLKSVMLSVHLWDDKWRRLDSVLTVNNVMLTSQLPWIIGEHGFVAYDTLYQVTQNRFGILAWSWYGNGPQVKFLDMNVDYGSYKLTGYGDRIVNGPFGIVNTAQAWIK